MKTLMLNLVFLVVLDGLLLVPGQRLWDYSQARGDGQTVPDGQTQQRDDGNSWVASTQQALTDIARASAKLPIIGPIMSIFLEWTPLENHWVLGVILLLLLFVALKSLVK